MEPRVSSRGLPCERLFLDLVELLEGLFREKSLQSLGRGSEMPRDAGSLEQAVRGHGRYCQGVPSAITQKRKLLPKSQEPLNVAQNPGGSWNSARTHTDSVTRECLCYPKSFSLTHGRSSIAIAGDASERARARARLFRQRHGAQDIASLSRVTNAATHISGCEQMDRPSRSNVARNLDRPGRLRVHALTA